MQQLDETSLPDHWHSLHQFSQKNDKSDDFVVNHKFSFDKKVLMQFFHNQNCLRLWPQTIETTAHNVALCLHAFSIAEEHST